MSSQPPSTSLSMGGLALSGKRPAAPPLRVHKPEISEFIEHLLAFRRNTVVGNCRVSSFNILANTKNGNVVSHLPLALGISVSLPFFIGTPTPNFRVNFPAASVTGILPGRFCPCRPPALLACFFPFIGLAVSFFSMRSLPTCPHRALPGARIGFIFRRLRKDASRFRRGEPALLRFQSRLCPCAWE